MVLVVVANWKIQDRVNADAGEDRGGANTRKLEQLGGANSSGSAPSALQCCSLNARENDLLVRVNRVSGVGGRGGKLNT